MSFKYDVFLNHNKDDIPAVVIIANRLVQERQVKCWLGKWELVPGEPFQEAIEDALDNSEVVAVFVGPHGLLEWQNEEMRAAIGAVVYDNKRRVIPVLLPGAVDVSNLRVSKFLRWRTWVDFRASINDTEALNWFCSGIRGIKPWPVHVEEHGGLPLGSYLPFIHNHNFTGRDSLIDCLADHFFNTTSASSAFKQAVTGMGGLGKTELVVEFAHRYGDLFKGVHWLDLRDVQALDGAIALCGTKMGYTQIDQNEVVRSTMKAWIEDGPRLLILDNFEDMSQIRDVLARFDYPSLRLLITSRRKDFPKDTGIQVHELNVFSETDSLRFLKKILEQPATAKDKKSLAKSLGYLPLALEMAAYYININRMDPQEYLEELENTPGHESMEAEWYRDEDAPSHTKHDPSLFSTFQLSWREIKDETQQKIFMIAGYLAPNTPIPLEIFQETLGMDKRALLKALYRLDSIGLLPAANGLPTIHPLLGSYARTLATSSEGLLERLSYELAKLAKHANEQVDQTGNLGWFVPLRPHITTTVEFAEKMELPIAAKLLSNLGYYLQKVADYKEAKSAFARALKIDETVYGPHHAEVATDLNNLGFTMYTMSEFASAKSALERALKIDEAVYSPDHPDVATNLNNLGMVLQALGDLMGAQAAYERALKIDEAAYGLDHPEVAKVVNNAGSVLQALEDLAGAQAAYERALKIDEAVYGPNHPDVARDMNNIGGVLFANGDFVGAKASYERALHIEEAVYGSDDPNVAREIGNLGTVLRHIGDLAGAKAAFEQALKIDEAVYGPVDPNVARDVNNLGTVLLTLGKLAEAKAAYERALQIDEVVYGPNHTEVAREINNLGNVLRETGDLAGAKAAFERALKINEDAYGPNHTEVATDVNNLGNVLRDIGDLAGAKSAFERALSINDAVYGSNHPEVATNSNNLGSVLRDLGDLAGAKIAIERALKIDEMVYGLDHPEVARDVSNLGLVMYALRDISGAILSFERALKIDEVVYGPDHPNVARDVSNLGGMLQVLGDLASAKSAYERALQIDEKVYGPDHPNVATRINNLGSVLLALEDPGGAKSAFERALKIDEDRYGPDVPKIAIDLSNLGNALKALDDLTGAQTAFERALKIDEAVFGPDHPNVANRLNGLAGVLQALGDVEGAKAAYERVLMILKNSLPEGHPSIKRVQENLDAVSKER
jgi:tetratricopeptide (TPR) repeat protein